MILPLPELTFPVAMVEGALMALVDHSKPNLATVLQSPIASGPKCLINSSQSCLALWSILLISHQL